MKNKKKILILVIMVMLAITLLVAFTGCMPVADAEPGEGGGFGTMQWIMIGAMVPLVALMVIPQMLRSRKQKKAASDRMEKLSRGDKVMLNDGVYGVIDAVDSPNNTVVVDIGCGDVPVMVKLNIAGIHRIIEPEEEKQAEQRRKDAEKAEREKESAPPAPMSADDLEIERRREEKRRAKEERKAKNHARPSAFPEDESCITDGEIGSRSDDSNFDNE